MTVERMPIPKKARNRDVVPWRLSLSRELNQDEMTAVAGVFLAGTKHHYLIQGNTYPGLTMLDGDYFATKGRGKDLSQVARRWDMVSERFPELFEDSVLEYRVPSALLDPQEDAVLDITDLTQPSA